MNSNRRNILRASSGGKALYNDAEEFLSELYKFVEELKEIQKRLISQINKDTSTEGWLDTENLYPHARLIQILDGLSLSICSNLIPAREGESKGLGQDEFDLLNVPRKNWDDRVTITLFSKGERKIVCAPYPFDLDPLKVRVSSHTYYRWRQKYGGMPGSNVHLNSPYSGNQKVCVSLFSFQGMQL